ncbi:MAG TPA: BolA family protein [Gammaproteobacteria bacterium]|nr:BolA family protein [Gammaproteobacteria bacterium]
MNEQRIEIIKQRLNQKFSPAKLEVIDDSEKHKGHAGSRGGAGHYTVIIGSAFFSGKSRVEIHREIYDVLNDLIPHEIHALQIKIER